MKLTYRYEDDNILDSDNTNLDYPFTAFQVSQVSGDDGDYFIEYGSEYMMRQYKYKHINNTDGMTFIWRGRSTYDTRRSPMFIQVYNVNSNQWETLARETRIPPDTDFTAQVSQTTNMSNYYTATNVITFRSYQQVL